MCPYVINLHRSCPAPLLKGGTSSEWLLQSVHSNIWIAHLCSLRLSGAAAHGWCCNCQNLQFTGKLSCAAKDIPGRADRPGSPSSVQSSTIASCLQVGVLTDVSARRHTAEAMHLCDKALAATSEAIVITDPNMPDNPIIYCNAGFERLTGTPSLCSLPES